MRSVTTFMLALVLLLSSNARADTYQIFKDEAAFTNAVKAKFSSSNIFKESFEGDPWTGMIKDQGKKVNSVLGANDITWAASAGNFLFTHPNKSHNSTLGILDGDHADPGADVITGKFTGSNQKLYAIGGWFTRWDANKISISLDGNLVDTRDLQSGATFFGVISTDGFRNFTLSSPANEWGADDFTFVKSAATPIPGAVWLLAPSLVALVGFRKKTL